MKIDRPRRNLQVLLATTCLSFAFASVVPQALARDVESGPHDVEHVAVGFDHPWGMAFLPGETRMLVAERTGQLKLVDRESGDVRVISGLPAIHVEGQGGLLDVVLHPQFESEPWVYLTWTGANQEGLTSTHLGRGQLDLEALTLTEFEVLFVAEPFQQSDLGHYGSRLVFDDQNRLYMTIGDRQSKEFGPDHVSQDTTSTLGTTLRFEADGSIPADNPFVGDPEVADEIFSYGHRNVQAMAFRAETGELWQAEHGEFNGDEINVVEAGGNYGWPIAHYGVDYESRERFADPPPERPETVDPVFFWPAGDPEGFPPSGLAFYDGDAFPEWVDHMFVGNLAHEYLGRFSVDGQRVEMEERLLEGEGWRIRDVAVGPDSGFLYVLIDDADVPLIRLRPVE